MGRRAAHVLPAAVLAVLVAGGVVARRQLGFATSLAGVQAWVADVGWWAPAAFVAIVVFRQFLALPAALVLAVGGLCFGGALGTVLGTAGIVLSGLLKFALARALGREWLRAHVGAAFARAEARLARLGPTLVGVGTAYPVGPLSPFHWAAGLAPISAVSFTIAIVLGAPVRASAYAFLGASMLDVRSLAFRVSAGLLLLALVPLASARFRRLLFAGDPPLTPADRVPRRGASPGRSGA